MYVQVLESCIATGALRERESFDAAVARPPSPAPSPRNPRIAMLQVCSLSVTKALEAVHLLHAS